MQKEIYAQNCHNGLQIAENELFDIHHDGLFDGHYIDLWARCDNSNH